MRTPRVVLAALITSAVLLLLAAAPAAHCGPASGPAPGWRSFGQDQPPPAGTTTPWHSEVVPAAPLLRRLQQTCARGTHRCGGRCVSDADPKTCGKRCTPCPAPSSGNGTATCSAAGACGVACSKGFAPVQRECSGGKACATACRRVCPAGQQANARGTACSVCPDNTFKPNTGPAPCTPCPAGARATGKRASDHDAAADCKPAALPCPAGQEADATGLACRVCADNFYKDAEGPGPCTRCPPAFSTSGDTPQAHDSAQDCFPIACPPGIERDTVAGGCKVCAANHFKATWSPEPCTKCPAGSTATGSSAADHDEASDCREASCPPGQQPDAGASTCVVCPADTFKAQTGGQACAPCPPGSRAPGPQPADHDEASDCRVICPAGEQADAAIGTCVVCPADTFKAADGPEACVPCPSGTRTLGPLASDHNDAGDCRVSCPAGQQGDPSATGLGAAAATPACTVCPSGFYKDAAGPGTCTRCPPATIAVGNRAEDHDSAQDCYPISCPPGKERDTVAGGCKVCAANHFKSTTGPNVCEACPAGSVTLGPAAADHDDASDCLSASCRPGQQADPGTGACVTCPADTFKPDVGSQACTACPEGTRTLGQLPADHDDASDCLAGGLLPSGNLTGSFALQEALDSFGALFERSLNNSGKRNGGRGTGSSKGGKRTSACLYECSGGDGYDAVSSRAVAHLAGSPPVYRSDNPADVRAGTNQLGVVYDQGSCSTCVSAVISSAATAAVAAALRIDGTLLEPLAHDHSYHCSYAWGDAGPRRSCGFGWRFDEALRSMQSYPGAFFMNSSCLKGADLTQLSFSSSQLAGACSSAKSACGTPGFVCSSVALADGIWSVQRWIRTHGAALARIRINERFKNFFQANATGVFEELPPPAEAPPPPEEPSFWHAVLLVGYNNTGFFWYARNSWGSNWADGGIFRLAYGALGVGHPEETYGLKCSPASNNAATRAAWSDPWPVKADPSLRGCYLYTASAKDTISGMADHFGVDVVQLVLNNTRRGVIPTELRGDPPRPEPQLDGPWTGRELQLCGLQEADFGRVAAVVCTSLPVGGNATWSTACSNTTAGNTCSGACTTGLTGSPTATCGSDGRWNVSGSCVLVTCTTVPTLSNAVFRASCSGRRVDTICAGTCAPGFSGEPEATCGANGQWAVSGSCSAVTCESMPAGGSAVWPAACSGRPAGATCAGSCAAGSAGSPVATCGNDGRWSVAGTCTQVTCNTLPAIGNATWSAACSGRAAGSSCSGTCASGFDGAPTAVCGNNGNWAVSGACKQVICSSTPAGGNAVWPGACSGRPAGASCTGSCAASAVGTPTATCGNDGRWTVTGSCLQVSCSGTPSGGSAGWPAACSGQASGSSCSGTCAAGFRGSPTAACGSDGQWTVSGSCSQVTCSGAPPAANTSWAAACTGQPAGTTCTGMCADGFTGSPTASCSNDGRWVLVGSCTQVTCNGVPSGGSTTWSSACASRSAGSSCIGTCAPGFAGSPMATCGNDGRWSVAGSCSQVTCNTIPTGGNATWQSTCSGLAAGSSCTGTCAAGFSGSPTAACGSDSNWAVSGTCVQVTCGSVPSGGSASWPAACSRRPAGATCNGTCVSGFTGSPTASCGNDGRWVLSASCTQVVQCSSVPAGANATWSAACSGRQAGATCSGTCAAGLTGAPTATCSSDGKWTVSGSCAPVTCNTVPSGGFATWSTSCSGQAAGSTCTGTCLQGYAGSPSALCRSDAEWLVTSPCLTATCSGVPSGGSATWDAGCAGRLPDDTCTGTCLSGFTGFPTASCGSDGRWAVTRGCVDGETRSVSADGADYTVHISPKLTWEAAKERCRQDGMQLLRLYSQQQAINVHAAVSQVTDEPYWIGLSDTASEGSFVWCADGALLTASQGLWRHDQPDNAGNDENCVTVRLDVGWGHEWNDRPCSNTYQYVCMDLDKANACARYPCTTTYAPSTSTATCTLAPAGRTCACADGYTYAGDTLGCLPPLVMRTIVVDDARYRLFTHLFTWEHADYLCRRVGTRGLVKMPSADIAARLHTGVLQATSDLPYTPYWIGLNDRDVEGTFVWQSNGSAMTYTNWASDEPNNAGGEDCVHVLNDETAYWNDEACGDQYWFVCDSA